MILGSADGHAPRSIIGKIARESAEGDRYWPTRQHWPEVYRGDGLCVQRIILTLEEIPRMTLSCHYILVGPLRLSTRELADAIGISKSAYWSNLRLAEAVVDSGIKLLSFQPDVSSPVN